jgi:hypothetical protein
VATASIWQRLSCPRRCARPKRAMKALIAAAVERRSWNRKRVALLRRPASFGRPSTVQDRRPSLVPLEFAALATLGDVKVFLPEIAPGVQELLCLMGIASPVRVARICRRRRPFGSSVPFATRSECARPVEGAPNRRSTTPLTTLRKKLYLQRTARFPRRYLLEQVGLSKPQGF